MPLFLFGQQPLPPNVGPSPFQDGLLERARQRAADENRISDLTTPFIINELGDKGWEEILGLLRHTSLLPAEIGSAILEPGPAGQGEEAAIALQQERERQAREAARRTQTPKPIKVEQSDP